MQVADVGVAGIVRSSENTPRLDTGTGRILGTRIIAKMARVATR
jgi:hypothetical protein